MQRVEGAQRRREWLRCAGQDRTPEQDKVHRLEPLGHRFAPRGRVLRGEGALKSHPVDRSKGLDGDQLARNKSLARSELLESPPSRRTSRSRADVPTQAITGRRGLGGARRGCPQPSPAAKAEEVRRAFGWRVGSRVAPAHRRGQAGSPTYSQASRLGSQRDHSRCIGTCTRRRPRHSSVTSRPSSTPPKRMKPSGWPP
jgi:hypothetical protein